MIVSYNFLYDYLKEDYDMLDNKFPYFIRKARLEEWDDVMAMTWKTFVRFEAKDYTKEGVRSFFDFISDPVLQRMFINDAYPMFVAEDKGKIIGMITLREGTHISLLFVDEAYHRQGVGSSLMRTIWEFIRTEVGKEIVTVNAAPYGVGFYHKLGFTDLGPEEARDGIRYTPMKREL